MAGKAEQLVHESETQRQYVRVTMPALVEIEEQVYEVSDLSSGGFRVQGFEGSYRKGKAFPLRLVLPFHAFTLDVDLEAEVRHYNKDTQTMGCRFINLTEDKMSVLNHVLRSFIAGDLVGAGDVINVVARENYVKVRHHADGEEGRRQDFWKRQALPLAFIALLGLMALFIIGQNIYNGIFVLESSQAYIESDTIVVRNPVEGIYEPVLEGNIKSVQSGQVIGTIGLDARSSSNTRVRRGGKVSIESPCDCYVLSREVKSGEYIVSGSEVMELVEMNSVPWVTAVVSTREAQRIAIGDKADVYVAGSDVELVGTVTGFNVNDIGGPMVARSEGFDTGVQVRIQLEQKIPVDLTGRPARVDFNI